MEPSAASWNNVIEQNDAEVGFSKAYCKKNKN